MYQVKCNPFFQGASFKVINPQTYQRKKPKVEFNADFSLIVALTLAKAGLYGGSPQNVYNTDIDLVMHTYHWMICMNDYQETEMIINEVK